jgi:hypothetical protein
MTYKLNSGMKGKFILFIFSFCIVPSAFSQQVLSLHALFREQDAILIPQAEGTWSIKGFDEALSIKKAGDNFYILSYGSEENTSTFEAVFVKIKDELFLDLSGVMSDTLGDEVYRGSFIKCHTFYKVQITKDTLCLSSLNYEWFYNCAFKNKLPLRFEWIDNAMLLTLGTDELKLFFTGYKNEKGVFKDYVALINKSYRVQENSFDQLDTFTKITASVFPQKCIPEFPFKEGWLGGDGDVSVCLNETQTLFIFSDTYVAAKTQDKRGAGMRMVSNSVAVETCLRDSRTEVHYFWNNMYSDNPEPIFKSFTNRYKFWVKDAFVYKLFLYVLLEKIGAKQGVAPDDIFSFSQLGYTLAKIPNPSDSLDKWHIELIPLPDFSYPSLQIQTHVIKDNYLYFFINRNDKSQLLVRKKLDFIDIPQISFEYYSTSKTWLSPIREDDMYTLVNGFRAITVNYHPEMKQWVMVCDIPFPDNKIRIRTAAELMGPWSDEKIVYECPEVTPGSALYSKSNFCYLPRECIQNYDDKKHTMLITYDINNSDLNEINSNPKIYTPKVIKVSLK